MTAVQGKCAYQVQTDEGSGGQLLCHSQTV